ncbi:reverse transcriptase [Helicobacter pylori]|uniref:RNA-directed DNA polymerase n=1 Tax=Helicobacter pylori TaxID=210 RepID=UPI000D364EBD|nr:RNA-directed DNA polymerase [Helicobacter pylori]PUD88017.1 reverse transcriptase [Helicobacter pylori]
MLMKKVKEKTYFECLDEISQNKLFKGLLGYGMFVERIPNLLTSKPFYRYCKNNENKIFPKRKMGYQHITYEGIRDIGTPRYFAIPNPLAYYNQCKILRDNWDKLKEYFKEKTDGNTHKISRIHIQKIPKNKKIFQNDYSKDRVAMRKSIFDMGHKNIFCEGKLGRSIRIGARYKLKADISTCFPSIYTHSIPWAISGKEIAKKDKNHWSDEIDTQTRNMNHKETMGILIGPHSSNLISEIILVAVDRDLKNLRKEQNKTEYRYIRHIDDYTCYVNSRDEAEQFTIDLAKCLKKYNLSLNHKKTKIFELPLMYEEEWINQLKIFKMDEYKGKIKYPSVVAFLDKSIALIKQNDNKASILKYAIKMLNKKKMTDNAREYYFSTLHHLALLYPYLIPCIEEVFDNNNYSIQTNQIQEISKDIFKAGSKNNNHEACSYALYFSLKYDFEMEKTCHSMALESNDCIFMLLGYLRARKDSESSAIDEYLKRAETMIKSEDGTYILDDEFWLFAYEVLRVENENALKNCNGWSELSKKRVSFIKKEFQK